MGLATKQALLRRIGKCIQFGCKPEQLVHATRLVRHLSREWPYNFSQASGATRAWELRQGPKTGVHEIVNILLDVAAKTRNLALPPNGKIDGIDVRNLYLRVTGISVTPCYTLVDQRVSPDTDLSISSSESYLVYSMIRPIRERAQKVSHATEPILHHARKSYVQIAAQSAVFEKTGRRFIGRVENTLELYENQYSETIPFSEDLAAAARFSNPLLEGSPAVANELSEKIEELVMDDLRKLESDTWDRKDAIEDMGSAAGTRTNP